jgi:hypothetical protein
MGCGGSEAALGWAATVQANHAGKTRGHKRTSNDGLSETKQVRLRGT